MIIGPGSFYTSLMPIFLVRGVAEALKEMKGPVVLVANLLTEGPRDARLHRGRCGAQLEDAIDRPVDVVMTNTRWPSPDVLGALRARAQGAARAGRRCRRTASWSAASSGPARLPATIACGWRTRSGACCPDGC